mmetsp:Transcript_95698/g.297958  ORF Transcript_95698/g.297958 Transcript_95698/m.297958 type:complete len:130 (+) Transcript_95698:287-676(+)
MHIWCSKTGGEYHSCPTGFSYFGFRVRPLRRGIMLLACSIRLRSAMEAHSGCSWILGRGSCWSTSLGSHQLAMTISRCRATSSSGWQPLPASARPQAVRDVGLLSLLIEVVLEHPAHANLAIAGLPPGR